MIPSHRVSAPTPVVVRGTARRSRNVREGRGGPLRTMALAAGLWATMLLAGCVQSDFNLATRHQDYTVTSASKEVELGRRLAHLVKDEVGLVQDEPLQQRVKAIGARLAAVSNRQELVYTFTAIEDEHVNAFSLPGGYVFVNSGLIDETASDDELAGVLAHEVAHVAARHAIKRYEGHLGLQIVQLAALAARQGEASQGIGIAGRAAQLAYARQDELEADRLAVAYLRSAGFDPRGMLRFLKKLREVNREAVHYLPRGIVRPYYASTHPFVPERIRTVKEELFGVADYLDYLNTPE